MTVAEPVWDADYVVGFTGTRKGMTDAQKATVERLLSDSRVTHASHGDCVGADAEFHKLARARNLTVFVNPPTDDRLRAFCHGDWTNEPLGYLTRNKVIVTACDVLIATPKEAVEASKGGTWYTVRYARMKGRRTVIIWPDGSTHIDGQVSD